MLPGAQSHEPEAVSHIRYPLQFAAMVFFMAFCMALTPTGATAQEMVLGKDGTSLYHRPACPVVRDGQGVVAMTRAQAEARGLKAHDGCDPAKVPPEPAAPASPGPGTKSARPAAPTYVSIDARGRHYHRDGCKKLGKVQKKLVLDAAAKKYWPCPVCRPPIRKRKG